eukprot:CAMPEP_0196807278 /NCGR_PEP_ID=MMETSP1362-20130617/7237_1 /TAXON_ID=163516 /ORGANISM="Leptocylindrus danicus, Strain CCMP1856" /LENGTH=562 /DNA_ID=CAMNT_0042181123 /DNA_START=38 /DNA_END=1726 /DNA_ORIENTATION=-
MVFSLPYVPANTSSWGPPKDEDISNPNNPMNKWANLPYAPYSRGDRLSGRSVDFTSTWKSNSDRNDGRRTRESSSGKNANEEFQYKVEKSEQASFQLVDTAKAPKRFVAPAKKRAQQQSRLRQLNARARGGNEQQKDTGRYNQPQRTRRRNNWGKGGNNRKNWHHRVDRQASVAVKADWVVVDEITFPVLSKQRSEDLPSEEDLFSCGFLDQYNDAYERVTSKTAVPLKRFENKEFYPVTTTDDPVIENLAIEQTGNVFATDVILAHLMASPRSVIPWDIVVQKLPNGTLFFDKRDSSQFDFLTVSETANQPPLRSDDDPEGINSPERLSLEATTINQNFSQQILRQSKTPNNQSHRKNFDLANPFYDEDDGAANGMEPASVAYKYRRFTLGDIRLVCRCELHGLVQKRGEEQTMTAFALNEWDSKLSGGINWRDKIDTQRGAVLATELKNNSCKLAKWTAQSILAGADQMKIGYVSRVTKSNAYEHVILATQFYKPKEFAQQTTLSVNSMWGIVKMLVEFFGGKDEGKYVIMRDPNKPILRIFSVPPSTFEEDDNDEEDEE